MSREGGNPSARRYARIAAILVIALYIPYFFLPVTSYPHEKDVILGWEFFLNFSQFWPITLGHVLLWAGWAYLATRHFLSAAVFGGSALILSLACIVWWVPLPSPNTAIYVKLACMAVLVIAGIGGYWRYGRR
jgi:hypothetical protein